MYLTPLYIGILRHIHVYCMVYIQIEILLGNDATASWMNKLLASRSGGGGGGSATSLQHPHPASYIFCGCNTSRMHDTISQWSSQVCVCDGLIA